VTEPTHGPSAPAPNVTVEYAAHPNAGRPVGLARETTRNAILMIAARSASLVISIGSIYFFTRVLSKDEYAFWGVINLIAQTCIVFTDLGMGLATDRWLPGLNETHPENGRTLSRVYVYCSLSAATVFCLGLIALARPVVDWMLEGKVGVVPVYLATPFILSLTAHQILGGILRGTRRFEALSWCIPVNQIVFTAAGILFYFPFGIGGFILGNGLGQLPALVYFSRPLWSYLGGVPTIREIKAQLKLAWPFHAERYLNFGLFFADQWLVAGKFSNQLKNAYNVPRTFFDRITTTLDGLTAVPLTALSAASGRGTETFTRGIVVMRRAVLYIFGFICVSLLAGSRFLMDILAGPKYAADAIWPFRIFTVMMFFTGAFMIQSQAVNAGGRPIYRLKSVIFQNIAYLLALALLTKPFGLYGVSIARVIGAVATGLAASYFLRKIVVVRPDWVAAKALLPGCMVLLAIALVGQHFYYSRLIAPLWLGVAGLSGAILVFRAIPDEDILTIEHILPRRLTPILEACRRLRKRTPSVIPAPQPSDGI